MVNALEQRMFKDTADLRDAHGRPTPCAVAWDRVYAHMRQRDSRVGERPIFIHSMARRAWIKRFPPARAAAIEDACARVNQDVERVKQSYDLFPKGEQVAKLRYRAVKPGKARCIMGPNLVWLARLGPWFVAYGEHVKRRWSKSSQIYFTSGANAQDLGKWLQAAWADCEATYGSVAALEDDFGEFDGSQGQCVRLYLYRRYVAHGAPRTVRRYISAVFMRGGSRRHVRMRARAKRSSGDPDTSVGNSEVNAGSHTRLLDMACDATGYPRTCWRMAVQGDDMVAIAPRPVLLWAKQQAAAFFAELGLVAKPRVSFNAYEVEYCSGRFYWCARQTRVWGPKPGRWLSKGSWRYAPAERVTDEEWRAAVRSGLYCDAGHVPILRVLARPGPAILRGNRPPSAGHEEADDRTFEEFCLLYSVTPQELRELELAVANTPLGGFIDHPAIDKIVNRDVEVEVGDPSANANWILADGYDLLLPISAPKPAVAAG